MYRRTVGGGAPVSARAALCLEGSQAPPICPCRNNIIGCVERWRNDADKEKTEVLREKPGTVPLCPPLSLTWTELGSNPGLSAERPVPCHGLMLVMLHVATGGPHREHLTYKGSYQCVRNHGCYYDNQHSEMALDSIRIVIQVSRDVTPCRGACVCSVTQSPGM